jgi:alkanesulfonate monooxygenase SsuD/methylene tetrahydromethanopterin reductase-like flavin-dependent oxidoreductase (luciferase family)
MEVLAEQVEVIHRQWTEEAFDFAGKHYTLEDCRAEPKPLQEPHPPLIVGGNARPGTLQPALRFADEYNTPYATRDEIRERARVVAQACEEAGREPLRFSIMSLCLVGTDEADLHERARRAAERMGTDQAPEEFLEQWRERSIAGTVDEVIDVLRELESYGVERALLQQLDHTDLELIELLGREVAAKV